MALKAIICLTVILYLGGASSKIYKPCHDLHNYQCIGRYLSKYSECSTRQVSGDLPSEYFIKNFYFNTPFLNGSNIDRDVTVFNHNDCFVSKLFHNSDSKRTVLALDCPNLGFEADRIWIEHKTYEEDKYYSYHVKMTYPLLRITINFPNEDLDLCNAYITTDMTALPDFHYKANDDVTKEHGLDLSYHKFYEIENFNERGRVLTYKFIDSLICSYECPIPNYRAC